MHFPGGSVVKNLPANAGELVWSLGWEDSPREGKGYTLQYSYLGNSMDRGAWWATVHGVAKELDKMYQGNSNKKILYYVPVRECR